MEKIIAAKSPFDLFLRDQIHQLHGWADEGVNLVLMDMSEVSFANTMAIGTLVRFHQSAKTLGVKFRLFRIQDNVRRSMVQIGVAELLGIPISAGPPSFETTEI